MATQADIDRLEALLARGVLRVRAPDGSEITYASPEQMRGAIASMRATMATTDFPRTTFTSFARD
jgi:hypothetical protein